MSVRARRRAIAGGAVLAATGVLFLAGGLVVGGKGGPATSCVRSPNADEQISQNVAAWEPLEAIRTTGRYSLAPFGRVCTYAALDGDPTITVGPGPEGWVLTGVLIAGASAGVGLLVAAGAALGARKPASPEL
ncbi:hypothetical protein [uncultured Microbacterium sp.]|uniref:hypothetical protein n=1 Tax=uncultured Microbacterium sp. TaxID=191216 RepID=UPI0025F9BAB3|nr:hypothetical protein [uncultured Microbacterium sp.]